MSAEDITSGDILFHVVENLDLSGLFSTILPTNHSDNNNHNIQNNLHTKHTSSKKSLSLPSSSSPFTTTTTTDEPSTVPTSSNQKKNQQLTEYYSRFFSLNSSHRSSFLQQQQFKIIKQIHVRVAIRKYYENKLQYFSRKLIKSINYHKQHYLLAIGQETSRLMHQIQENQEIFQRIAFQSITQYYSILQQELTNAKEKLLHERYEKEILQKQCLLFRNLMIFNQYLVLETKQCIELTVLNKQSPQFQRCMKAVYDNLGNQNHYLYYHPDIYDHQQRLLSSVSKRQQMPKSNLIYSTLMDKNMKVLNIFKLKNTFLASNLQKISSKIPNSKMKGLFCCFPSEYIFNFSVYGIKEQQLFSSFPQRAEQHNRQRQSNHANLSHYVDPSLLYSMSPEEIFQSHWLFANQPNPLLPLSADYLSLYQQSNHYAEHISNLFSSANLPKPRFRFSKYSMISLINEYSSEQLENGVFLALCRVLIIKQKTVQAVITDADIADAIEQGYDAVFSSINDEYCLFQEQFILPEFLIHLSFPSLISSRVNELTSNQQERESVLKSQDIWYQHLFPPHLHQPPKLPAFSNKRKTSDSNENSTMMFHRSVDDPPHQQASAKTLPTLLSENYFDFVETLQNDQFKDEINNTKPTAENDNNISKESQGMGLPGTNSNQKNIMIKQNSLLNIENSVKECQQANQLLIRDSSKRMAQLMTQFSVQQSHANNHDTNESTFVLDDI